MRNNLLALLGAVAIAAAAAQIAAAGERQHVRKPVRAPSATALAIVSVWPYDE